MAEIIEMPKLSDTMTSGTLIKWLVKEGDKVSASDMIAEVETDKATMEVENFEDGVVLKIYVQEGDSVEIGSPICAIGEEGEEAPDVEPKLASGDDSGSDDDEEEDDDTGEDEDEKSSEEESSEDDAADEEEKAESKEQSSEKKDSGKQDEKKESEEKLSTQSTPSASGSGDDSRVKVSPLARKIAAELGIALNRIKGSGPGGRIVRADVEEAAKNPAAMAGPADAGSSIALGSLEETTNKVTNMRAAIAKALVKSKTEAPHFYLQSEVDAAPLATIRQDLNSFLTELSEDAGGIKFTVNDLILKAAAMAVLKVPAINRSWMGDKIKQFGTVNLAFGVAMDDGLVTPVINSAETKSLRQISLEAKDLIKKARNRKLKPDEMSGSTLTVTNLGMFGISDFYGIINPNNAAILSVGATVKKPVVNEHDQIVVGYRMKVGLSGDHRVIDGAVGAQYLDALRSILEKPSILLV
jgi:pyruvate dehydrogenase E2 component (dihydrolipoamide acetyltransferase)